MRRSDKIGPSELLEHIPLAAAHTIERDQSKYQNVEYIVQGQGLEDPDFLAVAALYLLRSVFIASHGNRFAGLRLCEQSVRLIPGGGRNNNTA